MHSASCVQSELIENGGDIGPDRLHLARFSSLLRAVCAIRLNWALMRRKAVATDITIFDEPIEDVLDQTYTVAINSYIGCGPWRLERRADRCRACRTTYPASTYAHTKLHDTGLIYRNEIVNFIREVGEVSAETGAVKDGRLQIIP